MDVAICAKSIAVPTPAARSTSWRLSRRRLLSRMAGGAGLCSAVTAVACRSEVPVQRRDPLVVKVLADNTLGREARTGAWLNHFAQARNAKLFVQGLTTRPAEARPERPETAAAVIAALAADPAAAQIVWIDQLDVPALGARGVLRPLDALVRRDRYDLKRFMPAALQPGYGLDAQLYALPDQVAARQVYFNHRHLIDASIDYRRAGFDFERPEMTWEALRRANLDLLAAPRARERLPFHPGQVAAPVELWGWQNGGEWLVDRGRRATFTRAENVQALTWLAAHARELGSRFPAEDFPPPARSGGGDDSGERHPFVTGRVSVCIESTRFVLTLANAELAFDLGYVELPRRFPGWHLLTTVEGSGYAIVHGAPDVAWEIAAFFVGRDAAIVDAWTTAGAYPKATPPPPGTPAGALPETGRTLWFPPFTGQLSIDKELAATYKTGSKQLDEARDHGLEQLRHAVLRPGTITPDAVWSTLEAARRAALDGRQSPEEALRAAERQAQAHLDAAWAVLDGQRPM